MEVMEDPAIPFINKSVMNHAMYRIGIGIETIRLNLWAKEEYLLHARLYAPLVEGANAEDINSTVRLWMTETLVGQAPPLLDCPPFDEAP